MTETVTDCGPDCFCWDEAAAAELNNLDTPLCPACNGTGERFGICTFCSGTGECLHDNIDTPDFEFCED